MIRAHQHAAGAAQSDAQSDAQSEALGYSRGGFSTKLHLRCEGNGKPVTFLLTVGERNESVVFEQLMEQGVVKRPGRGRPRLRPERVAGDKGYTGSPIRPYLRRRGIGAVIPRRTNESRRGTRFDRQGIVNATEWNEQSIGLNSFVGLPHATKSGQRIIWRCLPLLPSCFGFRF